MTKFTKRDMYSAIKAGITTGEWTVSDVEVAEFCDKEMAALDKKAAKAKEAAAKRKADGDALTEAVFAALTNELQTIADIAAKVQEVDPEATVSKVTYRLTQLVKAERAAKAKINVGDGEGEKKREVMAYQLA